MGPFCLGQAAERGLIYRFSATQLGDHTNSFVDQSRLLERIICHVLTTTNERGRPLKRPFGAERAFSKLWKSHYPNPHDYYYYHDDGETYPAISIQRGYMVASLSQ